MTAILRSGLAALGILVATQAAAQITFYGREDFEGRSFTTEEQIRNFEGTGFNDRASSVIVQGGRWEVCEDVGFSGRCVVLRPGQYPSLAEMGLNNRVSSVRTAGRDRDRNEAPQITFYSHEDFRGESFSTDEQINNLRRKGFNDRASSIIVFSGRWEVCEDERFNGRCAVLRPGRYPSLAAMGLNNSVTSVRVASRNAYLDDRRRAPGPASYQDYRRRDDERLYEADVLAVRAVVGPPEQRCWVERREVVQDRNDASAPGAIAGAVIGGILGHQIGDGRGRDFATAGGAVAGAVVGANVGRNYGDREVRTQDVRRCANVPSQARPDYWDVTYNFQGQDHRVQMTAPPGRTITVNERGEPRE
ncbi:MAG TPA: beta/gamma crystallin-related protein [Aromatoleum sp.]|uniref:beta/gamma crystallin-related protein n=1 Tax=Aromatoleum sp. TaxID=2307007 RepID=UPI002B49373C|nr:beta/gamma crystallin-related protein [Aromatoleum sp.]HJV27913.1 beta/gamma crystallin-related protein [Aromatoleum sp.]